MGPALTGTAVAINSLVVGWLGGILVLILGKAGIIVAKDPKVRAKSSYVGGGSKLNFAPFGREFVESNLIGHQG